MENSIIYMPSRNDLGIVFDQMVREDPKKLEEAFKDIARRVIEHSDQIKKIFEGEENE